MIPLIFSLPFLLAEIPVFPCGRFVSAGGFLIISLVSLCLTVPLIFFFSLSLLPAQFPASVGGWGFSSVGSAPY